MRYLIYIGIFSAFLFSASCPAQSTFRVLFYNVENLFDCAHDSLKNDYDFLPGSSRTWHAGRYKQKVNQIAKTIVAAGQGQPPSLVGLCEVENEKVMDCLTTYSPLKELGYRYVMTDSPDERGIDVALLYQRGDFRLLGCRSLPIRFGDKGRKPTRDLLHVTGLIATGDTLDVFVVHLPSRSGGEKESEPARLLAASVLKRETDSLFTIRSHPNLLIMGDFNDYPYSRSVSEVLGAMVPAGSICSSRLYNLMGGMKEGSYKFRGEWGVLDQLIVSGFLLRNEQGFHTSADKACVCKFPFLLEDDVTYGGVRPFRTYHGWRYTGGFSDHLPVMVDFQLP